MYMKLSGVVYGRVVHCTSYGIGMIKGLTNNVTHADNETQSQVGRCIVLVEWANGTTGIHPHGISYYKEGRYE